MMVSKESEVSSSKRMIPLWN